MLITQTFPFTILANLPLGNRISLPHPSHFSRTSAPKRRISHILLPQGWGFFTCTLSPSM